MAAMSDTVQFTARIDERVMRVVRKEADRSRVSINVKINQLLQLGIITLAKNRRATVTAVAQVANHSGTN